MENRNKGWDAQTPSTSNGLDVPIERQKTVGEVIGEIEYQQNEINGAIDEIEYKLSCMPIPKENDVANPQGYDQRLRDISERNIKMIYMLRNILERL